MLFARLTQLSRALSLHLRFDGLEERKWKLQSLISKRSHLLYCDHIVEHGERLFELACDNDLEGIVAKPKNSPYQFSDTETYWLKLKNPNYTQALGRDDLFALLKKLVEPTGQDVRLCAPKWKCE